MRYPDTAIPKVEHLGEVLPYLHPAYWDVDNAVEIPSPSQPDIFSRGYTLKALRGCLQVSPEPETIIPHSAGDHFSTEDYPIGTIALMRHEKLRFIGNRPLARYMAATKQCEVAVPKPPTSLRFHIGDTHDYALRSDSKEATYTSSLLFGIVTTRFKHKVLATVDADTVKNVDGHIKIGTFSGSEQADFRLGVTMTEYDWEQRQETTISRINALAICVNNFSGEPSFIHSLVKKFKPAMVPLSAHPSL